MTGRFEVCRKGSDFFQTFSAPAALLPDALKQADMYVYARIRVYVYALYTLRICVYV